MNRFDIGRRIEAYREKKRMSTQELAERIKRSQATISRIENGKQGLTFELLSHIAMELRVHPFALLSDEPLRHSVLLPASGKREGEFGPDLLANALHAGRVNRHLGIAAAAELVGVAPSELEAVELAISSPEDELLNRLCELYGLVPQEMRMLRTFTEAVPDTARSLAYLQQLFSNIRHIIRQTPEGEEKRTLDRICDMLDSTDSQNPLPPDSSGDDIGLFLNRLSLHLVNALKDKGFRGKVMQLGEFEETDDKGEEQGCIDESDCSERS